MKIVRKNFRYSKMFVVENLLSNNENGEKSAQEEKIVDSKNGAEKNLIQYRSLIISNNSDEIVGDRQLKNVRMAENDPN